MIGFSEIEQNLINNFNAQKLYHGIIIAGKKGIGKASFAKYFCHNLLEQIGGDVKADFRLIEKIDDKKSIGIDEIRKQSDFLHYTSAKSIYKFIVIDAICELTKEASNALLKSLEEPKKNSFYFLIAHNLSKILPTIQSRCLTIKVPEFSKATFLEILAQQNSNFSDDEKDFLSLICDNCPALAINSGNDLIKIYQLFLNSLIKHKISEELLKKIAEKNFSYLIIEKVLLHFYSQILKFCHNLEMNYCFNELEVFQILLNKISSSQILDLCDETLLSLENLNKAHLDKKLNFTNIFNRICYV